MKKMSRFDSIHDKQNMIFHNLVTNSKQHSRRKLKSIDNKKQVFKLNDSRIRKRNRYDNQQQNQYANINISLGDTIELPTFGDWKNQLKAHTHRQVYNNSVNHKNHRNSLNNAVPDMNINVNANKQEISDSNMNLNVNNTNATRNMLEIKQPKRKNSSVRLSSLQIPLKTINTEEQESYKQKEKEISKLKHKISEKKKNNQVELIKLYQQQKLKKLSISNETNNKNRALNPIDSNALINKFIIVSAETQPETHEQKQKKHSPREKNKQIQSHKEKLNQGNMISIGKYRRKSFSIEQHSSLSSKAKALSREVQINFETIDNDLKKIINRKEIFKGLYQRQKQKYELILKKYNIDEKVDDTEFVEYFKN